jgi:hypothetical protein
MMRTMRPRPRATVALGLLVVLLTGGAAAAGVRAGAGPEEAVYSTDFADPAAAATEWQFPTGETTETGKGYTLALTSGAFFVGLNGAKNLWLSPDVASLPTDQVVETTIAEMTGDSSVLAGVVCRGDLHRDLGYGFVVATDGYYAIGAYAGPGVKRLVNAKGTKRTSAIDPAGPNTVRAECANDGKRKVRLTLFVNDQKVASVVDRTSPSKTASGAFLLTEVDEGQPGQVTYSSFAVLPA